MRILKTACYAAAGLLAVIIAVHVWKLFISADAPDMLSRGDMVFTGILAAMLIGALWLAIAISREIRRNS